MIDRTQKPQYANAVRNARKFRGVSQLDMAKGLGVTNVCLSQIENGDARPSFKLLQKMADKLNYKLTIKFDEWEQK